MKISITSFILLCSIVLVSCNIERIFLKKFYIQDSSEDATILDSPSIIHNSDSLVLIVFMRDIDEFNMQCLPFKRIDSSRETFIPAYEDSIGLIDVDSISLSGKKNVMIYQNDDWLKYNIYRQKKLPRHKTITSILKN